MLKPEDAEKVLTKNLANVIRKANTGKPLTAAERALIEQSAAGGPLTDSGSAYAKTYDELAQRLGVSRKTLQNAAKRHPSDAPRHKGDGRHDVAAWSQFVIAHNIARSAENIAGAASAELAQDRPITVTDWKARELELKCEKLAIENARVAGELVEAAEIETGLSALVGAFRQALNNLPGRLAQKIIGCRDFHEAEEIILEEVNVILRTLQRCDFLEDHGTRAETFETASPVAISPAEHQGKRTIKTPRAASKPAKAPAGKLGRKRLSPKSRSAATSAAVKSKGATKGRPRATKPARRATKP